MHRFFNTKLKIETQYSKNCNCDIKCECDWQENMGEIKRALYIRITIQKLHMI